MLKYSVTEHGPLLDPDEAVARLRQVHAIRRTKKSLATQRCKGGGPPYVKVEGRIRYPQRPLDRYAEELNTVELREITPIRIPHSAAPVRAETAIGDVRLLPTMTRNALLRGGVSTVAELLQLSDRELLAFETIGERGLAAIRGLLHLKGNRLCETTKGQTIAHHARFDALIEARGHPHEAKPRGKS